MGAFLLGGRRAVPGSPPLRSPRLLVLPAPAAPAPPRCDIGPHATGAPSHRPAPAPSRPRPPRAARSGKDRTGRGSVAAARGGWTTGARLRLMGAPSFGA